ncbi:MAG: hypothetical protein J6K53_10165 [Roseburia sp.]|nr:hypothetical protein [Roseburia sp.]
MQIIISLLIVASGICWSVVYIDSIRTGFRQKTYCMPLFALGLNIAWEGIYAYTDLFVRKSIGAQAIANTCWFLLDIFIVVTWFRFAQEEFDSPLAKKWFVPWTVLVLFICFVLQILFLVQFGDVEGEKYSAYLQNVAMSIAYLYMLNSRKSSRGQTMTIAVCKCIGTLTPTIYGAIEGNIFIIVTGIICFVLDVMYIGFLREVKRTEQAKAAV